MARHVCNVNGIFSALPACLGLFSMRWKIWIFYVSVKYTTVQSTTDLATNHNEIIFFTTLDTRQPECTFWKGVGTTTVGISSAPIINRSSNNQTHQFNHNQKLYEIFCTERKQNVKEKTSLDKMKIWNVRNSGKTDREWTRTTFAIIAAYYCISLLPVSCTKWPPISRGWAKNIKRGGINKYDLACVQCN